eukprot:TRINITY_DN3841_c0_g1_i3.p1 TRINITY_DN3841_c0_g1~~TRINITY_DN3841_c0_g1_i3.p1  ORF type:complete len:313 (+),score=43.39 TRINITY_DN3841_c0_g1_i3:264-1202(+)
MMAASTRAAPLCTTAMAPLRAISCVVRLEVQTDPKLKGDPYRVWHPILFIPRYEPRGLFKKFDQRTLPKETPPIAARAVHRPDTTITIGPMLKSDSDPRYLIVPLASAAPLYANQPPPPDALAGRDFTMAPLVQSMPDSPAFSALAAPEGHPEAVTSVSQAKSEPKPVATGVPEAGLNSSGEVPKAPMISRKSTSRNSMAPPPKIVLPAPSSSPSPQVPTDLLIDLSTPRDSSDEEEDSSGEQEDEIFASGVGNPFASAAQASVSSTSSSSLAVPWRNPFLPDSPRQTIVEGSDDSSDSSDEEEPPKNWFDD